MSRSLLWTAGAVFLLSACGVDSAPESLADPAPLGAPVAALEPSQPADLVPDATDDGVLLGDHAPSFTATLPSGHVQQLPDEALRGEEPMTPEDAIAEALAQLARRADVLGDGVVLVAGMGHHGVPLVPESTDPADLDPDTPAIIADPTSLDAGTTYADCLGMLRFCAERTATLDGCVDAVPTCTSQRPWEAGEFCCPEGATDAYRAARARNVPWVHAFVEELVDGRDHFPGLRAVYEEAGVQ